MWLFSIATIFENDWSERYRTMKLEFVYFFNSSVILDSVLTWRKNAGISGSSIGSTLLVCHCVEAISVHVINVKRLDPVAKTIGNLSQLGTHGRISLALQAYAG